MQRKDVRVLYPYNVMFRSPHGPKLDTLLSGVVMKDSYCGQGLYASAGNRNDLCSGSSLAADFNYVLEANFVGWPSYSKVPSFSSAAMTRDLCYVGLIPSIPSITLNFSVLCKLANS